MWVIEEIQSDIEGKLNSSVGKLKTNIKNLQNKVTKIQEQISKDNFVSSLVVQDLNRAFTANPESMRDIISTIKVTTKGNKLKVANAQFVIAKLQERLNEEKNNLNFFLSVMKTWYVYLLILIIQKAKEDGAAYLGWIKDTPGGLSKNSSIYRKLYVTLPKNLGFQPMASPYYEEEATQDWDDVKEGYYMDFVEDFGFDPSHYGFIDPFEEEGISDFEKKFAKKSDWEEYLESGARKKFRKWYDKPDATKEAWEDTGEEMMRNKFEAKKARAGKENEIWFKRLNMQFYKALMEMKK